MEPNAEIERMIIRQLSGNATAEDERSIEQWLSGSEANRREYEKIKKAWEASAAPASVKINVDAEWESFRQKHFAQGRAKGKVISLNSSFVRYAAAAVILIGLIIPGIYFSGSETYATEPGERVLVSLSDGSEVILGENSTLEVPRAFNWFSRNLDLNGEGIFEVAKNPDKAFRIEGPQTTTQVLGTAFRLIASQERNYLSVTEGKVAYWVQEKADTLILTRGETARLTAGDLTEISQPENYDSWKTGIFRFEDKPVIEVLRELQDHYVFSIENLSKFEDVDCRFSGSFENQPLDEVLEELALTMGMEYELRKSELSITKFYCD